jgi:DNA-binding transcriptional LysR family regulator
MLSSIRSLLVVIEEGGVNRAARRLGTTQPTLSRHIQSLEQEFGAPLFERSTSGMRPTDLGFFLRDTFGPLLRDFERARADTIAFAHGRHQQLRIGYIGLAASRYLNASLAQLKREFPQMRLMLFDQTPGEQLQGLREGRLDIALAGQEAARLATEFYQRRAAQLGVCAVLPADHALAHRAEVQLTELKGSRFVGVDEDVVPGRNDWILDLCSKAGFRVKLVAKTENVSETFALVSGEGAVALLPDYLEGKPPPGIVWVRIADRWARWSLFVLRQRGRGQPAVRRLFELIGSWQA